MSLKPFKTVPNSMAEWGKWFAAQDTGGTTINSSTSTTSANEWNIDSFTSHYTLRYEDKGKLLLSLGGSATNVTVPAGVFSIGDQINICQYGAGAITLVAGSGTTLRTPSTLVFNDQYSTVTLIMIYNEEWIVAGRLTP